MSCWEFIYRNQSYWEEHTMHITDRPKLKSFAEFEKDLKNGFYEKVKMCLPLETFMDVLNMFPEHKTELLEMFNYKMEKLRNPSLWKVIK